MARDTELMHEPEELTYAECRGLLSGGVFGRLAVCTPRGAQIFPLNYALTGEAVVFRTSEDGTIARCDWNVPVAFEVDFVDYSDHRGWSVVAAGRCERVERVAELAQIRRNWDPRPWARGARPLYLRLAWTELTGRRLGRGWTHANELPVRRHL